VKTPGADLADILATDTPDLWTRNPPAKTGDTGKLFQRIIATALALKTTKTTDSPAAPAKRRARAASRRNAGQR
jgi:hypothetical protein